MIRDAVPGFCDLRQDRLRHPGRDGCHQRVQRPAQGRGPLGLRRRAQLAQFGHRHRQPGWGGVVHRRALPGDEGVHRRLLDHRGPRPRRGAQARRRRLEGLQSEGRGAAVPVSVVDVREAITQAHHEDWARVVAALTRRFGDLEIAEEAAAEAFAAAIERWPADGVPPNPGAWLTTTANRKAIDRIRRENKRDDKQKEAQLVYDDDPPEPLDAIDDERLRLIFTCCHPALAMETRVALTLRMVGGLTVAEIARAFLVQETTMGRRITRAKAKIKAAHIPYRVPSAEDLPARVSGVLAVLFLVFNEGYLATGPDTDPVRHDLTAEAIRLTRLLRALMPADGEVAGLLALMLLTEARRTARVSASGELVALDEQDRGTWDAALIAEGHRLVRERLAAGEAPGRYQILAAINAVHTSPATSATPTGRRSSPSTTSSSASTPRRSSPSTGPSRSPSLTARRWSWRPSTVLRTSWLAITPTTPRAPTCCAGWVAVRSRARRTTKPSSWRATPPRPPT